MASQISYTETTNSLQCLLQRLISRLMKIAYLWQLPNDETLPRQAHLVPSLLMKYGLPCSLVLRVGVYTSRKKKILQRHHFLKNIEGAQHDTLMSLCVQIHIQPQQ